MSAGQDMDVAPCSRDIAAEDGDSPSLSATSLWQRSGGEETGVHVTHIFRAIQRLQSRPAAQLSSSLLSSPSASPAPTLEAGVAAWMCGRLDYLWDLPLPSEFGDVPRAAPHPRTRLTLQLLALGAVRRRRQPLRHGSGDSPTSASSAPTSSTPLVRQWLWRRAAALPTGARESNLPYNGDLSCIMMMWAALVLPGWRDSLDERRWRCAAEAAAETRRRSWRGAPPDAAAVAASSDSSRGPVSTRASEGHRGGSDVRLETDAVGGATAPPPARVLRLISTTAPVASSSSGLASGTALPVSVSVLATGLGSSAVQDSAVAGVQRRPTLLLDDEEVESASTGNVVAAPSAGETTTAAAAAAKDAEPPSPPPPPSEESRRRWRGLSAHVLDAPPGSAAAQNASAVLEALGFATSDGGHAKGVLLDVAPCTSSPAEVTRAPRSSPLCPLGRLPPLLAAHAWLTVTSLRSSWLEYIVAAPPQSSDGDVHRRLVDEEVRHAGLAGAAPPPPLLPCVSVADHRVSAALEDVLWPVHSPAAPLAAGVEERLHAYLCFPLAGVGASCVSHHGDMDSVAASATASSPPLLTLADWRAYLELRYGRPPLEVSHGEAPPPVGAASATVAADAARMAHAAAALCHQGLRQQQPQQQLQQRPEQRVPGSVEAQATMPAVVDDVAAAAALAQSAATRSAASTTYAAVMDTAAMVLLAELRRVGAVEAADCIDRVESAPRGSDTDSAATAAAVATTGGPPRSCVGGGAPVTPACSLHSLLETTMESDPALDAYMCHTRVGPTPPLLRTTCSTGDATESLPSPRSSLASRLWLGLVMVLSLGESATAQYVRSVLLSPEPSPAASTVITTTVSGAAAASVSLAPLTLPTLFRSTLEDLWREEAAAATASECDEPRRKRESAAVDITAAAPDTLAIGAAVALRHPRLLLRQLRVVWELSRPVLHGQHHGGAGGDDATRSCTAPVADEFATRVSSLVECVHLASLAGLPPPLSATLVPPPPSQDREASASSSPPQPTNVTDTRAAATAAAATATTATAAAPATRLRLQLSITTAASSPSTVVVPAKAVAPVVDGAGAAKRARAAHESDDAVADGNGAPLLRRHRLDEVTRLREEAEPPTLCHGDPPSLESIGELHVCWAGEAEQHRGGVVARRSLTLAAVAPPTVVESATAQPKPLVGVLVVGVLWDALQHMHAQMPGAMRGPAAGSPRDTELPPSAAAAAPPPRRTLLRLQTCPAYSALQRLWHALLPSLPPGSLRSTSARLDVVGATPAASSRVDLCGYNSLTRTLRGVVCIVLGHAVYECLQSMWCHWSTARASRECAVWADVAVSDEQHRAGAAERWLTQQLRALHEEVLLPLQRVLRVPVPASSPKQHVDAEAGVCMSPAAWLSYPPHGRVLLPAVVHRLDGALRGDAHGSALARDACEVWARVKALLQLAGVQA